MGLRVCLRVLGDEQDDGLGVVDLDRRDEALGLDLELLAADALEAADHVVEDARHVRAVVCGEATVSKRAGQAGSARMTADESWAG